MRVGAGLGPFYASTRVGGKGCGPIFGGLLLIGLVVWLVEKLWFVLLPLAVFGAAAWITVRVRKNRAAKDLAGSQDLIRAAASKFGQRVESGNHFTHDDGTEYVALVDYWGEIQVVYRVYSTEVYPLPQDDWQPAVSEEMWGKHIEALQKRAGREARQAQERARYEADLAAHADRLAHTYEGTSRVLYQDDGTLGGKIFIIVTVAGVTRAVFRVDRDTLWHIEKVTRVTRPYWPAEAA